MKQDGAKTKELTKFVVTVSEIGRVSVVISGPHVNKRVLDRIIAAVKKNYILSIKAYRKQCKRVLVANRVKAAEDAVKLNETKI